MLITFKSKAAADIIMYEVHAKRILDLLGKDVKRGIITAAETGAAIAKLEAEIELERQHEAELAAKSEAETEEEDRKSPATNHVSFSARAFPLLDMLRAAHAQGRDIMWGV